MRKSFKLENLDCANCAAKMEAGINALPGVNKASISAAQSVCTSYEKDCRIVR